MAEQAAPISSGSYVRSPRHDIWRRLFGRDWKIAFVFIAPIVIVMGVFIAWPFIDAIYTSMTIRTMSRETRFVWFDNYIRLYNDPFYRQAVRNTLVFTSGAIFFKLVFGLIASLLLHGLGRVRNLITGLVLLPWIIPSVVQALAWRSIYDPLFGGLNPILLNLGLIDRPLSWLADPKMAMASVIAVNVWAGIPFFTVNILAGLSSIDQELYEAAEIDGANVWDKFLYITLPGLRYVIAVATLLSTVWTFNNFETIFLLTSGGPAGATKVYSIMAYEKAIRSLQFGPGVAVAFSLTPVLAFFILLLSRYMRRDVDRGELTGTWQDAVIDGVGRVIGFIGTVVSWPIMMILSGLKAIIPASFAGGPSRSRNNLISAILRWIALILLAFILFPFYWIMITAFKSDLQIGARENIFWPEPWTLMQFDRLFYDEPFFVWFGNSVLVSVSTTALAVVFAALGGYALARLRFRGAESMTTILLITYMLPGSLMFIPLWHPGRLEGDQQPVGADPNVPNEHGAFATWLLMGYYRSIPRIWKKRRWWMERTGCKPSSA
ncbi:MAG: ABC transporter permease subunit [Caldilineaceae bacterium]